MVGSGLFFIGGRIRVFSFKCRTRIRFSIRSDPSKPQPDPAKSQPDPEPWYIGNNVGWCRVGVAAAAPGEKSPCRSNRLVKWISLGRILKVACFSVRVAYYRYSRAHSSMANNFDLIGINFVRWKLNTPLWYLTLMFNLVTTLSFLSTPSQTRPDGRTVCALFMTLISFWCQMLNAPS